MNNQSGNNATRTNNTDRKINVEKIKDYTKTFVDYFVFIFSILSSITVFILDKFLGLIGKRGQYSKNLYSSLNKNEHTTRENVEVISKGNINSVKSNKNEKINELKAKYGSDKNKKYLEELKTITNNAFNKFEEKIESDKNKMLSESEKNEKKSRQFINSYLYPKYNENDKSNFIKYYLHNFFYKEKYSMKYLFLLIIIISLFNQGIGVFLPMILLNIVGLFVFILYAMDSGFINLDNNGIYKFNLFLLAFCIFWFINNIYMTRFYKNLYNNFVYQNLFNTYQKITNTNLNDDFLNYLVNYDDYKNYEKNDKFKVFSRLKDLYFNDIGNFSYFFKENILKDYKGSSKIEFNGLNASDIDEGNNNYYIFDDVKYTIKEEILNNIVIMNIYANDNKIGILDLSNVEAGLMEQYKFYAVKALHLRHFYDNIHKYERFNNYIDTTKEHGNTAKEYGSHSGEYVNKAKKYVENVYEMIEKGDFSFKYAIKSFYYSITVASTVGFGDIYPVGILPRLNFMFFALFVIIFLTYEIINHVKR